MQWWHRLCLCFALRFYFALAYYVLPQIAFTFGSCFGTSPLVDFPLVSLCRSKKALAFLDCRAVALSHRNFKSSFVQAQQLLSFLSGTACSLRTLYPLTVSFTTLILSCIVEHKYSAHCYYQGQKFEPREVCFFASK